MPRAAGAGGRAVLQRWARASLLIGTTTAAAIGAASCASTGPGEALTFDFDFDAGPQGFVAGFADYPPAREGDFELTSGHRARPSPLGPRSGLFISGINRSADLFMFFKGSITGLTPGARYAVEVGTEIATTTPAGCAGIGGPPGESVWIKAGASAEEPAAILDGTHLRMNIDIGNQSRDGTQAVVLGDIANSRSCEQSPAWELKALGPASPPAAITVPADGRVWVIIGADSGFEGRTEIYFTRASVVLTPIPGP